MRKFRMKTVCIFIPNVRMPSTKAIKRKRLQLKPGDHVLVLVWGSNYVEGRVTGLDRYGRWARWEPTTRERARMGDGCATPLLLPQRRNKTWVRGWDGQAARAWRAQAMLLKDPEPLSMDAFAGNSFKAMQRNFNSQKHPSPLGPLGPLRTLGTYGYTVSSSSPSASPPTALAPSPQTITPSNTGVSTIASSPDTATPTSP